MKAETPGSAPSYQWYANIEVACQNSRRAFVDWRKWNQTLSWGNRNNVVETHLPDQIARLNRMHQEICEINDLIHVADGIDPFFNYGRLWTAAKMRRSTPSAISILGRIPDLMKVSHPDEWLFEDRAPFLTYKVDLPLLLHQLRGKESGESGDAGTDIDRDSRMVCTLRMQSHQGPQLIGPAGDYLPDWPWTRQILRLRQGNSKGRTSSFDQ